MTGRPEVQEDASIEDVWDDVADVICVGESPGVLAYGIICETAGLDVLYVTSPTGYDADTNSYLAAMTADLSDPPTGPPPVVTVAVPEPLRRDARGRPDVLETFVGEHLRQWSARCLADPSGVVLTQVPEVLTRMRTSEGGVITAAPVEPPADNGSAADSFAGLVYQEGAIGGAVITGPSGPRRVRAEGGIALAIAHAPASWPDANALVSRPYARFARLEKLSIADD